LGKPKFSAANCSALRNPAAGSALADPLAGVWTGGVEACAAADVANAAAANEAIPLAAVSQRSLASARSRSRPSIGCCVFMPPQSSPPPLGEGDGDGRWWALGVGLAIGAAADPTDGVGRGARYRTTTRGFGARGGAKRSPGSGARSEWLAADVSDWFS
jgi:hypothetical protein